MSDTKPQAEVCLLASAASWIEGSAIQQLRKMSDLPGMKLVVGLPDLHPGKVSPIGAAMAAEGYLYPTLVGNDIGCGIGLWQTSLGANRPKVEAWAGRLRGLEEPWEGDATRWLADRNIDPGGMEESLGTIGGGNHFGELQMVERVENAGRFAELGFSSESVYLLVHSGSRALGEAVLRDHIARFGGEGLADGTAESSAYFQRHEHARAWALANRELIALRMLHGLNATGRRILDICHNWAERCRIGGRDCWLHRKGAAPSTQGPVVIPGSRGSYSYLVCPRPAGERSAYSLAHGAGRKWSRTDARERLDKRYRVKDLTRTELGSVVICEDKDLLYEEAPQAYKKVAAVIDDLVREDLVEVVAVLRPLVTYKVRR